MDRRKMAAGWFSAALLLSACAPLAATVPSTSTPAVSATTPTLNSPTAAASSTPSSSPSPRPSATPAPSPTPIPWFEPAGCLAPPDLEDNPAVEVNGWTLDARTVAMLEHAQTLYGGPVDLLAGVTQGSYHDNGSASFGTHLGGGAVDISVFLPNTWTPDYPGLLRLVRAMRAAGFAAWVRDLDEVYPGSGIHIHAIAIGDPNLSDAAEAQLTGPAGYFRGFDGLPNETPTPDRYGGPVLCAWMVEAGYADLRETETLPPWPPADWQERLKIAASESINEGAAALASRLGTVPAYLEGPLAGWLLRQAGLLPPAPNPARRPLNFLLSPEREAAFLTWFSDREYHHRNLPNGTAPEPLVPGDLVVLRGETGSVTRIWVVVETRDGQAFAPAPVRDPQGNWSVALQPLDGPGGLLLNETYSQVDLLRRVEAGSAAGMPITYMIQPGDTLPALTERLALSLADLISANPQVNPAAPRVGQTITTGQ